MAESPDAYQAFAEGYHWLHPQEAQVEGTFDRVTRSVLNQLAPGACVLDASAGIGLDAVVLARRGLRVTATDASPAMLRLAREHADASGVEVDIRVADWRTLSNVLAPESFDAVLCMGNSIAHLSGAEMQDALAEFAAVLKPEGLLLVDTHHWEQVVGAGDRLVLDPEVLDRDGRRCRRCYVWRVEDEDRTDPICHLSFVLETTTASVTRVVRHGVTFEPFSVATFLQRIRSAGLRVEYCDAAEGSDLYMVVARKR